MHYLHALLYRLAEAIKLFKVWLRQRGFTQESGHPDGFVLAMAMAALLEQRVLARAMSSYQVFRVTLQYLGTCCCGLQQHAHRARWLTATHAF